MSWSSALPPDCDIEVLEANLAALDEVQPDLATRVRWPVSGERVVTDPHGKVTYRIYESDYVLTLSEGELEEALASARAEPRPRRVLLFGLGLGDGLARLCEAEPELELYGFERDPWLLRLSLMRRDYTSEILSGRLRFGLGTDLLGELLPPTDTLVLRHPLLGQLYREEAFGLVQGIGERRALICTGGLLVEPIALALRERGFGLWPLDLRGVALEELDWTVERFAPELVCTINYTDGLAEFCHRHGIRLLCWEIDPATADPAPCGTPTDHARVFTYRRAHVDSFREAGFEHARYLPLAADPDARRPRELSEEDRERYGAPLSFVGSSLVQNAARFRRTFVEYWCDWREGAQGSLHEGAGLLERALLLQASREFFDMESILEELCPEFLAHCREVGSESDPMLLAGEIAASQRRLATARGLADHGLELWGDAGWRSLERDGARYRGLAGNRDEVNRIYASAQINLDLGRLYQSDITTLRVFDILACGGFILAEHTEALEECFEIGVEVESYTDGEDLQRKVEYYLAHPEEARVIAERGRRAVLERHTVEQRLEWMLESFEGEPLPAEEDRGSSAA